MSDQTWKAVEAYFESELIGADAVLEAALRASAAAGLPDIQVSASQGKLLHLLALTLPARRILEVGTLGGYSALWLARALPPDGRLVTLEIDPHHAEVARQNFLHGGMSQRIDLQVGPALESLALLRAQRVAPFDLVFIDADKPNNPSYVKRALELVRVGSVIIVDNVVRQGRVADPQDADPRVIGSRQCLEVLGAEPRLRATAIQTVGTKGYDGFAMAYVVA